MDDNLRIYLTISPYDNHRLKIWAALHGRSAATYASQILAARIESNFQYIEQQLETYAQVLGISKEEAIERLTGDKPGDIVDTNTPE